MLSKIEDMKVRFENSGELSSSDKLFIESNYERILFKRFNKSGCSRCYLDAFIEIYYHIKKYGLKEMGKYILKREEVIHISGDTQVYTRANITDDVAVKYLKLYPNAINRFESYPEDWDKKNEEKIKKKVAKQRTKQTRKEPDIQNTPESDQQ